MTVRALNKKSHSMILALLFFVLFVVPTTFVSAQNLAPRTCECFCATDKGAKPPGKELEAMSVRECETACKKNGDRVAVCAFNLEQYPSQNVSCFTLDDCIKAVKNYCGDLGSKEYNAISCESGSVGDSFETGYQPPECQPGSHYCYPPKNSTSVRLNIQVGGTSQVNNLETYVQVVYQWMVTVGVVFAIVLVMIGGLQYVFGAASQEQIKKGKDRIKNAVIGLILLLSCILIIETVNPKLSTIAVPRLPMIKARDIAQSATSCETLVDQDKFKVGFNPSGPKKDVYEMYTGTKSPGCGTMGVVLRGPEDSEVAPGMTCSFQSCQSIVGGSFGIENESSRCIGSGKKAACFSCNELYDGNPELSSRGIVPSSSLCGQYTRGVESGTPEKPDSVHRCGWTKDGDFNKGTGAIKASSKGACVDMTFNCEAIRARGCSGYFGLPGEARIFNDVEGHRTLLLADTEPNAGIDCFGPCADFSFTTICRDNPCNVPSGCYYDGHFCVASRIVKPVD